MGWFKRSMDFNLFVVLFEQTMHSLLSSYKIRYMQITEKMQLYLICKLLKKNAIILNCGFLQCVFYILNCSDIV